VEKSEHARDTAEIYHQKAKERRAVAPKKLVVTIQKAVDLVNKDGMFDASDPFCVIQVPSSSPNDDVARCRGIDDVA